MDSLLRSFVASKQQAVFKDQFLAKMFKNLAQSSLPPTDCIGLYKLFVEWILCSDQPNLVKQGHDQLMRLGRRRPDIFREFINPNLLIDVFTNSMHSNKADMVVLVGEILDLLNLKEDDGEQPTEDEKALQRVYCNTTDTTSKFRENEDLKRSITNVARSHLVNIIRDHGVHLDVGAAIGKLYKTNPGLLPVASDSRNWIATSVVKLLAGYRPNTSTSNDPSIIDEEFVRKADAFSETLPLIWGQSNNTESITECLHMFYDIISVSDSYSRPSCALLSVITQVPSHILNDAMENMIGNNYQLTNKSSSRSLLSSHSQIQNHADNEGRTVTALQTMVEWLCERPSLLLAERLQNLFLRLHQSNRNSVLVEITHGTIEKLLLSLPSLLLHNSTEPLFFFLFLGFQHTETVFHQVVTTLPRVCQDLLDGSEKTNSNNLTLKPTTMSKSQAKSKKILERLKEAVLFLTLKFPEFPQLYKPLSEWLDPLPQISENRMKELESLSWLSEYHTSVFNVRGKNSFSSVDSTSNLAQLTNNKSTSSLSSSSLQDIYSSKCLAKQRSETGMVGLINLGNTCYMNSILQALFITDAFREMVLSSPVHKPTQNVLDKLQHTFSFLRNTMRAIYSPADFLKVARPPWFETGRQQDCSEFLRYLLDTLHEQEKIQKGDVVVYGEHQVLENTSESETQVHINENVEAPSQNPTEGTDDTNNLFSSGVQGNNGGSLKGVRASYSTTALDSISEAPENIDTDEDMISQGSAAAQAEDLMYGSRGSLSIGQKDLVEPDLSEDDSENEEGEGLLGSRGSLGLMRWTTEDNLSFGGSKEDRMDLIDGGTMHDSHSNSTDSGIQSVGDSIRGSSDSMSNQNPPNSDCLAGGSGSCNTTKLNGTSNGKSKGTEVSFSTQNAPFVSLVHKVFGGKWQTSYKCCKCHSVSIHKEYFTDLHLAFPDKDKETTDGKTAANPDVNEGKGKEDRGEKDTSSNTTITTAENQIEMPNTILKDLQCPKEYTKNNLDTSTASNNRKNEDSIQQLINSYLRPEKLTGENQYHCNKCDSLQDGIKTVKILEGPAHLMCTLMRFKYDRTNNRKSKVFTDVKYDLDLNIPIATTQNKGALNNNAQQVCESNKIKFPTANDRNIGKLKTKESEHIVDKNMNEKDIIQNCEKEFYSLYAIVVHSGYSSDGGHYYTYAKVPNQNGRCDETVDGEEEDLWYIFNDSKVSYSTFEKFVSLSKRYPVDSAYVLFYKNVKRDCSNELQSDIADVKSSLRQDLRMAVENDNIKFMREKERSSGASSSSSVTSPFKGLQRKDDDDDEKDGGGSYGSACGGNAGFNSPGRFVC